jgi:pSer/pThr/pTyr-binding forkhead associated (FHA) protein
VITCPKCTKENQDHYKFCLGCGAELPRDASPKKFAPGTPPHGIPRVASFVDESTTAGTGGGPSGVPRPRSAGGPSAPAPVAAAAPVAAVPAMVQPAAAPIAAAAAPPVLCPQCEHPNPSNNKYCASCGFKLGAKAASVPAPAAAVAAPAVPMSGIILTALRADGTEAGTYPMPAGVVTLGRDTGAIFAGDSYLSPRHATFTPRGGKLFVQDEASLNGVYKKLRREEPISVQIGDVFRIGQEILRIEPIEASTPGPDGVERLGSPSKGYVARIALVIGRDASGNAYPIPETGLHLGRERGDVLFPEDGYVSGLHCRIAYQNGQLFLTDLGSSNGSFVRLQAEAEVQNGDILLMGQQLFRITM